MLKTSSELNLKTLSQLDSPLDSQTLCIMSFHPYPYCEAVFRPVGKPVVPGLLTTRIADRHCTTVVLNIRHQ